MPWHSPRLNTKSFCLLDDDQFGRLSDKQRVEYLARAIDALEKLKLQIHRQLSGAAYGNQIEQSPPSWPTSSQGASGSPVRPARSRTRIIRAQSCGSRDPRFRRSFS
jgi:hypothetical protein